MGKSEKYPAPEELRNMIKKEMEKQEIGVRQLAKKANISAGFLSYILNGTRNVSEESIISIAKALNLNPSDLLIEAGFLPSKDEEVKKLYRATMALNPEQRKKILSDINNLLKRKDHE